MTTRAVNAQVLADTGLPHRRPRAVVGTFAAASPDLAHVMHRGSIGKSVDQLVHEQVFADIDVPNSSPGQWQVYVVNEVRDWIDSLDDTTHTRVVQAIGTLADIGPGLDRPLVDAIHGSSTANLKGLRPGTARILFAFDPWRDSVLLVAGDKAGRRTQWYREAIPLAEQRYERYLKERRDEEDCQR